MLLLQLAHVAGPVVRLQHGDRVLADAARREARGLRELAHEVLDEIGDVLAPLGETRHAQRHHVQAVIEILAEAPLAHVALEVAAGRGDDAHVDGDLLGAAEAQELLLDEHAQHLALRLERHVGDLVDVERAAVRFLERADLARAARAVLGAEQLLLDPVGRHGGGVEHDEGAVRAMRLLVQKARGELLAGAGRAADQDAAVGRRDAVDGALELIDGAPTCRPSPPRRSSAPCSSRTSRFNCEASSARKRHEHEAIGLERLLDVVVGAALDGGDGGLDVAVAGDDHDGQIGIGALDDGEHLEPVEPAALQPDVEDDELRPALLDDAKRLVAVARQARAVAFVLEDAGHELADVGLVVDDQDVSCHLSLLELRVEFKRRARPVMRPRAGRVRRRSRPASAGVSGKCDRDARAVRAAGRRAARRRARARRRAAR